MPKLDDELIVETPERVELRYALASVGNRFLAAAIDHLTQIILAIIVILIFNKAVYALGSLGSWGAAAGVLFVFAIYWGYFVCFETIWSGQTPGKRLLRLRVIREDGRPVRFFDAFVRNLMRLLDLMPIPSYAIGVVAIIFSPKSKRLGDYVAGTVVVKERATEAPALSQIVAMMREDAAIPEGGIHFKADMSLVGNEDFKAVQTFLKRRYELPPDSRRALALRIASPIANRLALAGIQLPPETFLEEIDRLYRAQMRYMG